MKQTCVLDSVVTAPTSSSTDTDPADTRPPSGLAACILAACHRDPEALALVARKLRPRMVRAARDVLGHFEWDAEDVVDEVFAAMLEGAVDIPSGGHTTRRLMRVTRNFARRRWAEVRARWPLEDD